MTKDLAPRTWDLTWAATAQMPPGPVQLWMVVLSDDHRILGAAPMTAAPSWVWGAGRLGADYGTVRVLVIADGRYQDAMIVAVAGRQYRPVFRLSIGEPQKVRKGWDITVTDGRIEFVPEPEFAVMSSRL